MCRHSRPHEMAPGHVSMLTSGAYARSASAIHVSRDHLRFPIFSPVRQSNQTHARVCARAAYTMAVTQAGTRLDGQADQPRNLEMGYLLRYNCRPIRLLGH